MNLLSMLLMAYLLILMVVRIRDISISFSELYEKLTEYALYLKQTK